MTKSHLALRGLLVLLAGLPLASRAGDPLIVVEDRGGTSALPYYEALNLQARADVPGRPPIPTPQVPATPADEAAMLPVRSAKLTPGTVARRVIEAPGLRPFVVIGDDDASRAWLQRRGVALRERGAVGLVVNVETAQGLARLRARLPKPLALPVFDKKADQWGCACVHFIHEVYRAHFSDDKYYRDGSAERGRAATDFYGFRNGPPRPYVILKWKDVSRGRPIISYCAADRKGPLRSASKVLDRLLRARGGTPDVWSVTDAISRVARGPVAATLCDAWRVHRGAWGLGSARV